MCSSDGCGCKCNIAIRIPGRVTREPCTAKRRRSSPSLSSYSIISIWLWPCECCILIITEALDRYPSHLWLFNALCMWVMARVAQGDQEMPHTSYLRGRARTLELTRLTTTHIAVSRHLGATVSVGHVRRMVDDCLPRRMVSSWARISSASQAGSLGRTPT